MGRLGRMRPSRSAMDWLRGPGGAQVQWAHLGVVVAKAAGQRQGRVSCGVALPGPTRRVCGGRVPRRCVPRSSLLPGRLGQASESGLIPPSWHDLAQALGFAGAAFDEPGAVAGGEVGGREEAGARQADLARLGQPGGVGLAGRARSWPGPRYTRSSRGARPWPGRARAGARRCRWLCIATCVTCCSISQAVIARSKE
jgi:hypothetical protein